MFVQFYHNTFHAEAILKDGFEDREDYYLTTSLHRGVWLADRPLDCNEGADGDIILAIDIPEEVVAPFEWVEDGKPYREFLVPAAVVNRYGPPRAVDGNYAGCTRDALLKLVAVMEAKATTLFMRKRAARVQELIPFMEKHGLLGEVEEVFDGQE